jgi:hypothetical protein
MRLTRRTALAATVVGLATVGAMVPAATAHANSSAPAGGVSPPTTITNGNNAGTYSVVVQGNVDITGNPAPQGIDTSGTDGYTPPACWLQPWYKQPDSWVQGDPVQSDVLSSTDADSYWWNMADKYPNLIRLINHINTGDESAREAINDDFEEVQKGQNDNGGGNVDGWIWWAPNWLEGSAGWACAQGLMGGANMNNGFLDLEPPASITNPTGGELTPQMLSQLARAALRLPTFHIMTSAGTAPGTTAYVNSDTQLWAAFVGPARPSDKAQAVWRYGTYLQARVWTSVPLVTFTVSGDPGAKIPSNALNGGEGAPCEVTSKCSITFDQPSTTPYTITATATWTVYWQATGTGVNEFPGRGQMAGIPRTITVREIQSVN